MSDDPLSPSKVTFFIGWYSDRVKWWYERWSLAHENRQKAFLAIPHSANPHELAKQVSDYDYEIQLCEFAFNVLSDDLDFIESCQKKRKS